MRQISDDGYDPNLRMTIHWECGEAFEYIAKYDSCRPEQGGSGRTLFV